MGGAAGHMAHPFDLPEVNTGSDLINFFQSAADYLQTNAGSVKIDGVNVSFKLIDGLQGKEFAVDRGSTKPIDIEGITISRVNERFPEGHGMRPAITTLLTILNEALPSIKRQLQQLGMWYDPTKFLNTEYVLGQTNVTVYDKNFLAIHGLNQFYEKTNQRTGVSRSGMRRPLSQKAPSTEIEYSDDLMESLVTEIGKVAGNYGFEVYGSVPTESTKSVNFSSTLSAPFTVNYGYDENGEIFSDTKPLEEWLSEANNPRDASVVLADGKKQGALSKLVYTEILKGTPMTELLQVGEDFWQSMQQGGNIEGTEIELAVDGAIIYHATRLLGNDVLEALTSPMGDVLSHEGVVIRGLSSVPVKITGEFIVQGLQTAFREQKELYEQNIPFAGEKSHIAFIPGGFKPPHKGHLEMVKYYYNKVGPNGKVIVLMGSGGKQPRTINGRPITLQDSMNMWETYLKNDPGIDWPSDQIEFQNVEGVGPIAPIIDYVKEKAHPETEVIHLGAGAKDTDRWKMMLDNPKNNPRGVELHIDPAPNMMDSEGNPLSATVMRKAVEEKDLDTFKSFIPDTSLHAAEDLFVMLSGALLTEGKEVNPLPVGIFLRLIEEVINEAIASTDLFGGRKDDANMYPQWNDQAAHDAIYDNDDTIPVTETSSMAAGDVSGGGIGNGTPGKKDDESLIREEEPLDKNDELVEEVMDYLLSKARS